MVSFNKSETRVWLVDDCQAVYAFVTKKNIDSNPKSSGHSEGGQQTRC